MTRVLVACETSGRVREAFRALGHNAWSCDILPADDGSPYHLQGDVLPILHGGQAALDLVDSALAATLPAKWDLMIAHPPCTYLCNSGVRWLFDNPTSDVVLHFPLTGAGRWRCGNAERYHKLREASAFFVELWAADIPRIAIENPIPHLYGRLPRYTQIVQPWQFGHGETKATCLWLKNLPKLVPTNIVSGRAHRIHNLPPGPNRWKERSKTYEGIAKAMSEQWGSL